MHYDRITITIPHELNLKLKTLAKEQDRSVSYVLSDLVRKTTGDPLVREASFEDVPDPRLSSASPQRPACTRCLSLGYACSAHREESVS